ncbi:tRNA (uracil(54)-C(5))-methyltransferase-like protein [Sciurus carolinensis]|uniref:tRNA (Uracil(54)-C(5))-methyltransferase-like protein n=1 Tax=Sciurus carolinensis TaxID=30640 RepID=A0AA41MX52_SCICA|nr:tRNA (uracil(54)-C(5))-methyltransferase-like protein [Sciurus carolinensis]
MRIQFKSNDHKRLLEETSKYLNLPNQIPCHFMEEKLSAQRASQILGIELMEQVVEDARWTAAFHGITNCEFYASRADKILPQLLKSKEDRQSIVTVVNPAHTGLHYQVVQAIRNCRAIHTLVFVSCKPRG